MSTMMRLLLSLCQIVTILQLECCRVVVSRARSLGDAFPLDISSHKSYSHELDAFPLDISSHESYSHELDAFPLYSYNTVIKHASVSSTASSVPTASLHRPIARSSNTSTTPAVTYKTTTVSTSNIYQTFRVNKHVQMLTPTTWINKNDGNIFNYSRRYNDTIVCNVTTLFGNVISHNGTRPNYTIWHCRSIYERCCGYECCPSYNDSWIVSIGYKCFFKSLP